MSFSFNDSGGWDTPAQQNSKDIIKETLKKEQVIKDIAFAQEDLKALLSRVKSVQGDVDKLTSENATLQMYIDNLTMQMARRR